MQERASLRTSTHDTSASASDFLNLHDIIAKARQNLNQNDWDYIVGGAESEATLRRNRMALDSLAFRPRVLRDVSKVDCSVTHFGRKLRLPVVLAHWRAFMRLAPNPSYAGSRSSGWRIC